MFLIMMNDLYSVGSSEIDMKCHMFDFFEYLFTFFTSEMWFVMLRFIF